MGAADQYHTWPRTTRAAAGPSAASAKPAADGAIGGVNFQGAAIARQQQQRTGAVEYRPYGIVPRACWRHVTQCAYAGNGGVEFESGADTIRL